MDKDEALLVAGNLTSVSEEVTEQWRMDSVNTILFSQLYANSEVDRFSSSQKWYQCYVETMSRLSWKSTGYRFINVEQDAPGSLVLNSLIKSKLGAIAGLAQTKQFDELMCSAQKEFAEKAMASSLGKYAMVRKIEGETSGVSTVALSVSLLGPGPALYSVFICFGTTQEIESDIFGQVFNYEVVVGEISIGISKMMLNTAGYVRAGMREKILNSLPDDTHLLVLDIAANCDAEMEELLHACDSTLRQRPWQHGG